jgi:hypothetical protein
VAMILWYLDLSFVVFVGGVVAMILWYLDLSFVVIVGGATYKYNK